MLKLPRHLVESTFLQIVTKSKVLRQNNQSLLMVGVCPFCLGGPKKRKSFYLYEKQSNYNVECKRGSCGYSRNFNNFLNDYSPNKYDALIAQCYKDLKSGDIFKNTNPKPQIKLLPNQELNLFLQEYFKNNCVSLGKRQSIEKMEKMRRNAAYQMSKRGISKEIWKKYFFCYKGNYIWRVIIPFINDTGLYYNFQARDIMPNPDEERAMKKYIFAKFEEISIPDDKIYKQYLVNKNETVFICEGILDSEFLANSVALCGVQMSADKYYSIVKQYPNRIWCVDNPFCDLAGYKTISVLLQKEEKCFIIPKEHIDCKDLNDLAKKFHVEALSKDYIIEHTLQGKMGWVKLRSQTIGLYTDEQLHPKRKFKIKRMKLAERIL